MKYSNAISRAVPSEDSHLAGSLVSRLHEGGSFLIAQSNREILLCYPYFVPVPRDVSQNSKHLYTGVTSQASLNLCLSRSISSLDSTRDPDRK